MPSTRSGSRGGATTLGGGWKGPAAPTPTGVGVPRVGRAYRAGAFTLTANQWTKIPLDTVSFDPGNNFDIANSRYICPSAGLYTVFGQVDLTTTNAVTSYGVAVYRNGALATQSTGQSPNQVGIADAPVVADVLQCALGDVLELWAYDSWAAPLGSSSYQSDYLAIAGALAS